MSDFTARIVALFIESDRAFIKRSLVHRYVEIYKDYRHDPEVLEVMLQSLIGGGILSEHSLTTDELSGVEIIADDISYNAEDTRFLQPAYVIARGENFDRCLADVLPEVREIATSYGLRRAERALRRLTRGLSRGEFVRVAMDNDLIRLDRDDVQYSEINSGLAATREIIRAANDISSSEQIRLIQSSDSALSLWGSTELKVIQIRVGIILTLHDAADIFASTAKAVTIGVLIDTVKSFVKSRSGVDLDNI